MKNEAFQDIRALVSTWKDKALLKDIRKPVIYFGNEECKSETTKVNDKYVDVLDKWKKIVGWRHGWRDVNAKQCLKWDAAKYILSEVSIEGFHT